MIFQNHTRVVSGEKYKKNNPLEKLTVVRFKPGAYARKANVSKYINTRPVKSTKIH